MKPGDNLCILNSHSQKGWGKIMASNPAEILTGDASPAEIKEFVDRQQAKQRLVIGYLSYDFGARLHGVKLGGRHDLATPDVWLAGYKDWQPYTAPKLPQTKLNLPLKPVMSRNAYSRAYQNVKNYIRGGDAYQINLTHRLEGSTNDSGQGIFDRLAHTSEADFQAYLNLGDLEIVSQSPERFIKVHDREIMTMPIKGTRPRGKTKTDDLELRKELLNSPKDQAELNMITDLMRNDLGEVCLPGSVRVSETREITAYPSIWHTHSTIKGRLNEDVSPIGALMSVLPGGSITGCPKKRAMEIINELEPVRRGIYTGTIFTISPDGELDSNIAIRTLIKSGEKIYLSVGGGIVYDSDEADEYQESLDKAASFTGSLSSDNDM